MKITDLCLIFIAIVLPIIIVVYINVSYTIKAEEQEMYYEQLINSAIEDATSEMKQIENEDKNIDYGYSGEDDKKVSISAEVGVKAFFNSLYNNFGIRGNEGAERYLQLFIPVVAVMDYNGVYISSIEKYTTYNEYTSEYEEILEHRLKPKKYFTYTYYILSSYDSDGLNKVVPAARYDSTQGGILYSHTIEFTMDDYVTHRGASYSRGVPYTEIPERSFYLADTSAGSNVVGDVYAAFRNNTALYRNNSGTLSSDELRMIQKIIEHLRDVKDSVIIETITNEIAYSVNANNLYARNAGIKYDFVFPTIEQEKMGEYINDIGVIAFIQGLSIGNKYLNTEAYSVTRLELVNKYYLSLSFDGNDSKFNRNLYHISQDCPEYRIYEESKGTGTLTPSYVSSKQQAASVVGVYSKNSSTETIVRGFYPCPICNP